MNNSLPLAVQMQPGTNPVLLIHGFGSSAELSWGSGGWFRALEEFGSGYIAPDLPGHGNSPKLADPAAYRVDALAEHIVHTLDRFDLEAVDVIAYSLGSQIARALAVEHPDRVRKLVLGGLGTSRPLASWDRSTVEPFIKGEATDAGDATALLSMLLAQPGVTPESMLALIDGIQHGLSEGIPSQPTLMVVGERDEVSTGADQLASAFNAELVVLPRRTHFNALSARAFKEVTLAFLSG